MNISLNLLKAEHIGARTFRNRLFKYLKGDEPIVITEHGQPVRIVLDYNDILELLDILDELSDIKTVKAVKEGRKAVARGTKGVSTSELFNEIRSNRKKK